MKRLQLVKISLGGGKFRGRVTILGDPYERGSAEERLDRMMLLSAIAGQPELTVIAGFDFETFKMWHNGQQWQLDFESDLDL
jgi:hypothetical protein